MLFKVFYQPTKSRSPKRETTQSLFLEYDLSPLDGIIEARKELTEKTDYNVEFIDPLSPDAEEYERAEDGFKITTL